MNMRTLLTILFAVLISSAIAYTEPVNNDPGVTPPPVGGNDTTDTNNTLPPDDPEFSNPLGLGFEEYTLYTDYLSFYVRPTGAAISNHVPVSWCPNEGIACDETVSSEAVGRSAMYAAYSLDKPIFDRYVNYYWTTMKHPETGHMMWKLDKNGQPTSGGGGINSAVDGELEMLEGLFRAVGVNGWSQSAQGYSYEATISELMRSLKGAVISTKYGPALNFCMYAQGSETRPCTQKVFVGYLNLKVLGQMCERDAYWCGVRDGSRALSIAALQQGGIYTSYEADNDRWGLDNFFVHQTWVIEHLLEDGSAASLAAATPYYDRSRLEFMSRWPNGAETCQEFYPGTGCKVTNPPIWVYAERLEEAAAMKDYAYGDALAQILMKKCRTDRADHLCAPDNFGNIIPLQAFATYRAAGGSVPERLNI